MDGDGFEGGGVGQLGGLVNGGGAAEDDEVEVQEEEPEERGERREEADAGVVILRRRFLHVIGGNARHRAPSHFIPMRIGTRSDSWIGRGGDENPRANNSGDWEFGIDELEHEMSSARCEGQFGKKGTLGALTVEAESRRRRGGGRVWEQKYERESRG